jgi:hypothetical protein
VTAAAYKKTILTTLASALLPARFRRRGATFVRRSADVLHLVQLQSSQKSTEKAAIVTVNLGVFSTVVEMARGGSITAPTEADCHWRQRLGFVMPAGRDIWWEADTAATAMKVGAELAGTVSVHGLPALDELASTAALVRLWQSGASPGLTGRQRRDYLAALAKASA